MQHLLLLALCLAVSAKRAKIENPPADVTENGEPLWYVPGFYNVDVESEIRYLYGQSDVMWGREKEIFDHYLPEKAKIETNEEDFLVVADMGCGPGATAFELLKAYPGLKVVCVDVQKSFIAHAEEMFAKLEEEIGKGRFETRIGTVLNSTLSTASVDVVLTRLTLQHIPNLSEALSEMHRVLKPGGKFFVIDTDESMGDLVSPRVQAVEDLTAKHSELRGHRSHEALSLHLWDWLTQAGFSVQRYDTASVHSQAVENLAPYAVINDPAVYYSLSNKGIVRKGRVDRAILKWDTAVRSTGLKMLVHFFFYVAEKPVRLVKQEL